MINRTGPSATVTARVGRGVAVALLAAAILAGFGPIPTQASAMREIRVERPHMVPRTRVPPVRPDRLHGPQNHAIVARTVLRAVQAAAQRDGPRQAALTEDCDNDPVCEIGDTTPQDGRKKLEDRLDKEKGKLEEKKKALQKKVDEIEKKFLKSKAGKAAKKEIDRLDKREEKENKKAFDYRNAKQGENCCGLGERARWQAWLNKELGLIRDYFDKARNEVLDREMKKADAKQAKARDKAKQELKATEKKLEKVETKLQRLDAAKAAEGGQVVEP